MTDYSIPAAVVCSGLEIACYMSCAFVPFVLSIDCNTSLFSGSSKAIAALACAVFESWPLHGPLNAKSLRVNDSELGAAGSDCLRESPSYSAHPWFWAFVLPSVSRQCSSSPQAGCFCRWLTDTGYQTFSLYSSRKLDGSSFRRGSRDFSYSLAKCQLFLYF